MKNRYESDLLGSLHETALGLHKIGVINEQEMREYDRDCLVRKKELKKEMSKSIKVKKLKHATA